LLYVNDVDSVCKRAVAAGTASLAERANQFDGDRTARSQDPAGNLWMIATHKEDVPPEEVGRRFVALMKEQLNCPARMMREMNDAA
jgi:PhnB protein